MNIKRLCRGSNLHTRVEKMEQNKIRVFLFKEKTLIDVIETSSDRAGENYIKQIIREERRKNIMKQNLTEEIKKEKEQIKKEQETKKEKIGMFRKIWTTIIKTVETVKTFIVSKSLWLKNKVVIGYKTATQKLFFWNKKEEKTTN